MLYEDASDTLDEKNWIQKYIHKITSSVLKWKKKDWKEIWQNVVAQGGKLQMFFFLLLFYLLLLTKEHYLIFKLGRRDLKKKKSIPFASAVCIEMYPEEIFLNIYADLCKRSAAFFVVFKNTLFGTSKIFKMGESLIYSIFLE